VPKHIVKATWTSGQMRITLPRMLYRSLKWEGALYMILEENKDETVTIRRFISGESLEGDSPRSGAGSD